MGIVIIFSQLLLKHWKVFFVKLIQRGFGYNNLLSSIFFYTNILTQQVFVWTQVVDSQV